MDHSQDIPNLIIECPNGDAIEVAVSDLPCWVEEDGSLFRDPPEGIDANSQGWWLDLDQTQKGATCVRLQVQPGEDSLVVTKLTYDNPEKRNLDGWSFRLVPPPPLLGDDYFELADPMDVPNPRMDADRPGANRRRGSDPAWAAGDNLEEMVTDGDWQDSPVQDPSQVAYYEDDTYADDPFAPGPFRAVDPPYPEGEPPYGYSEDYEDYPEALPASSPGLGRWMIVIAGIFFVGLVVIQIIWMVAFRPLNQRARGKEGTDGNTQAGAAAESGYDSPLAGGEELHNDVVSPGGGQRNATATGGSSILGPINSSRESTGSRSPSPASGQGVGGSSAAGTAPNGASASPSPSGVGASPTTTQSTGAPGSGPGEDVGFTRSDTRPSNAESATTTPRRGAWTIVSEGGASGSADPTSAVRTSGPSSGATAADNGGNRRNPNQNSLPPSMQSRFPGGLVLQLGGGGSTGNSLAPGDGGEVGATDFPAYSDAGLPVAEGPDPAWIPPATPGAGPISIDSVEEVDRATTSGLKLVLLNIFLRINQPLHSSRPVEIETQFYERRPGDLTPRLAEGGHQGRARVARPEDLTTGSIIKLQFRYVQRVHSAEYEGFIVRLLQGGEVLEQRVVPESLLQNIQPY